MSGSSAVLLDTCAMIWIANGIVLSPACVAAVRRASRDDGLYVSTASAWEIGLLSRPKPTRPAGLQFHPDPMTWFARFMAGAGVREAPITPAIAIDASYLPADFHADPMDRLIVSTARHLGLPVVTSDRKIIDYAKTGNVRVIPC